jgi:cation diffusion facilitator CzcD-associated flavoprotein CzcO
VVEKVDEEDQVVKGEREIIRCKFLAIASGHHAKPHHVSFPGQNTFPGQ